MNNTDTASTKAQALADAFHDELWQRLANALRKIEALNERDRQARITAGPRGTWERRR